MHNSLRTNNSPTLQWPLKYVHIFAIDQQRLLVKHHEQRQPPELVSHLKIAIEYSWEDPIDQSNDADPVFMTSHQLPCLQRLVNRPENDGADEKNADVHEDKAPNILRQQEQIGS